MGRLGKRLRGLIAIITVTTTLVTSGINITAANAANVNMESVTTVSYGTTNQYGLASNAKDGTILQAWNWSFNNIKNNMKSIAEAGYTSVQVSPIQGTKENTKTTDHWWLLYQPTNFTIGNVQLGTRDEFKQMCDEAHKYGLKIIVDVVANHTANRGGGNDKYWAHSTVDPELRDDPNCWNEHRPVSDWKNRWEVTHLSIGQPDLNTANYKVQDKVINFLNDAISCGADGFRFDAAKHIELPSDPGASNFWTRVLGSLNNRSNLFIYGEVLQGDADAYTSYPQYMNVTASNYGHHVTSAVGFNSGKNVGLSQDYDSFGVNADKLITWVESHDTYANDKNETTNMNSWQIKMGWALIASRAYTTPLYFNRPNGDGKFPGSLGDTGNNDWKDPDVVAVNKFHNAMEGQGEYLRKQSNDVMMIERGTKGAVIVNLAGDTTINSDTKLANGTYTNKATTGGTFTVSNGRITGNLPAGITVLYNDPTPQVSVSASPESCEFVDLINVKLNVSNAQNATYSINGGSNQSYTDGQTITLGKDAAVGDKINLTVNAVSANGSISNTYVYTKVKELTSSKVYFYNTNNWSNPTIYVYNDEVTPVKIVEAWPGTAMTKESDGSYSYTLPANFGNAKVIFSDKGNNQVPGSGQEGFIIANGTTMEYKNGVWQKREAVSPKVSISKDSCEFTDSLDLTLGVSNAEKATYTIDNSDPVEYTDGKAITIGKDAAVGDKITVKLSAASGDKSDEKTYTYTKVEKIVETSSKVYFKNTNNWSNPTVYVYNDETSTVKNTGAWPGVAMTNEGNGLYSYTLPEGFGNAKVIFNNKGNNQVPGSGKAGFALPSGKEMIYDNGSWTEYSNKEIISKVYFKNTNNWGNPTIYVYSTTGSAAVKAWPGVAMTNEGNGLYSYTIPANYGDARVIFSDNGNNQYPGQNQDGLLLSNGKTMIYDNGNWQETE